MRIQTTPFGSYPFKRSVASITAALFLFTGIFAYAPASFAQQSSDIPVQGGNPSGLHRLGRDREIRIPPELGTIEEVYNAPQATSQGPRGEKNRAGETWPVDQKTIVFLQDAHDSFEAQENIAKIIDQLVADYGVRTVFEEGYEGPVPTDKYFGFIKDPKLKEKISYFLMDRLRVGGAEYAHINRATGQGPRSMKEQGRGPGDVARGTDWQLIGADSLKLHKENIAQYRLSASKKDAITQDLKALDKELKSLADRRFPRDLKGWLKTKELFDAKKLDLFTYLSRSMDLLGTRDTNHAPRKNQLVARGPWPVAQMGLLQFILDAVKTNDPVVIEKAKHIDAREIFGELNKLEDAVASIYLKEASDKQLFEYYKILRLLDRLNDLQVSQEEYQAVKASLKEFDTDSFAAFIFSQAPKTLILSRMWELNIKEAVKFYEIANERDNSLSEVLEKFLYSATVHGPRPTKGENNKTWPDDRGSWIASVPAVLVYGGFHKENIKRILESKGISYLVVSPRITQSSPRHEEYYKRLMIEGYHAFETPLLLSHATRPLPLIAESEAVIRAEVRSVYDMALRYPDQPETWDRFLARSEMRSEKLNQGADPSPDASVLKGRERVDAGDPASVTLQALPKRQQMFIPILALLPLLPPILLPGFLWQHWLKREGRFFYFLRRLKIPGIEKLVYRIGLNRLDSILKGDEPSDITRDFIQQLVSYKLQGVDLKDMGIFSNPPIRSGDGRLLTLLTALHFGNVATTRRDAATLLGNIEASEIGRHLRYVMQNDPHGFVRNAAKEALENHAVRSEIRSGEEKDQGKFIKELRKITEQLVELSQKDPGNVEAVYDLLQQPILRKILAIQTIEGSAPIWESVYVPGVDGSSVSSPAEWLLQFIEEGHTESLKRLVLFEKDVFVGYMQNGMRVFELYRKIARIDPGALRVNHISYLEFYFGPDPVRMEEIAVSIEALWQRISKTRDPGQADPREEDARFEARFNAQETSPLVNIIAPVKKEATEKIKGNALAPAIDAMVERIFRNRKSGVVRPLTQEEKSISVYFKDRKITTLRLEENGNGEIVALAPEEVTLPGFKASKKYWIRDAIVTVDPDRPDRGVVVEEIVPFYSLERMRQKAPAMKEIATSLFWALLAGGLIAGSVLFLGRIFWPYGQKEAAIVPLLEDQSKTNMSTIEIPRSEMRTVSEAQPGGDLGLAQKLKEARAVQGLEDGGFGKVLLADEIKEDLNVIEMEALAEHLAAVSAMDFLSERKEMWLEAMTDPKRSVYFLVAPGGQITGRMVLYKEVIEPSFPASYFLTNLATYPRGDGNGTFFLDTVMRDLKAKDVFRLVWDADIQAAGFYHRFLTSRVEYYLYPIPDKVRFVAVLTTFGDMAPSVRERQKGMLEAHRQLEAKAEKSIEQALKKDGSVPHQVRAEIRSQEEIQQEIRETETLKNGARMRARQFLKYNRELIRRFLEWDPLRKTDPGETLEAAELALQRIRDYAETFKAVAEKIQPDEGYAIAGEQERYEKLGQYGVKPPEGITQEEVTLGLVAESRLLKEEIDPLPVQFLEAHRAKDLRRLRELNAQAVALQKARLKAQLLQAYSYLREPTVNQTALWMVLTAIRLGYLKISHQYGWTIRRALKEAAIQKIQVVGGSGVLREVYDYQNFKMTTAEDAEGKTDPVTIVQDSWIRQELEDGTFSYKPEPRAHKFEDLPSAIRSRFHTLLSQELDFAQIYDRMNDLDYIADILKTYGEEVPGYYLEEIQESVDFIMHARRGGLDNKRARVDQKGNAAANITTAVAQLEAGNIERAIEMLNAAKKELERRLVEIEHKKDGVNSQAQYFIHQFRRKETARAIRELQALIGKNQFQEGHQLLRLLYKTHYLPIASEDNQYASLQRSVSRLGSSFRRLSSWDQAPDKEKGTLLVAIREDIRRIELMTSTRSEVRSEDNPEAVQRLLRGIKAIRVKDNVLTEDQLKSVEKLILENREKFGDGWDAAVVADILVDIWVHFSEISSVSPESYERRLRLLKKNYFNLKHPLENGVHAIDALSLVKYIKTAGGSGIEVLRRFLEDNEKWIMETKAKIPEEDRDLLLGYWICVADYEDEVKPAITQKIAALEQELKQQTSTKEDEAGPDALRSEVRQEPFKEATPEEVAAYATRGEAFHFSPDREKLLDKDGNVVAERIKSDVYKALNRKSEWGEDLILKTHEKKWETGFWYELFALASLNKMDLKKGIPRLFRWGYMEGGYLWLGFWGIPEALDLSEMRFDSLQGMFSMFVKAGGVLDRIHKKGMVHNDVKPGNILANPQGDVQWTDFGLASSVGEELPEDGTPGFVAPEEMKREDSDVFSFIMTIITLLDREMHIGKFAPFVWPYLIKTFSGYLDLIFGYWTPSPDGGLIFRHYAIKGQDPQYFIHKPREERPSLSRVISRLKRQARKIEELQSYDTAIEALSPQEMYEKEVGPSSSTRSEVRGERHNELLSQTSSGSSLTAEGAFEWMKYAVRKSGEFEAYDKIPGGGLKSGDVVVVRTDPKDPEAMHFVVAGFEGEQLRYVGTLMGKVFRDPNLPKMEGKKIFEERLSGSLTWDVTTYRYRDSKELPLMIFLANDRKLLFRSEVRSDPREVPQFPLTAAYIKKVRLGKEIITDRKKVTRYAKALHKGMYEGGYVPALGKDLIPESLDLTQCVLYRFGRINIKCFKLPEVRTGSGNTQTVRQKFALSICDKNTVIGHGIVSQSDRDQAMASFRFSIHGDATTSLLHGIDYSGLGYGKEALTLIMAMCARGGLFTNSIQTFWYSHNKEYDEATEVRKARLDGMKEFLKMAGFNEKLFYVMRKKDNSLKKDVAPSKAEGESRSEVRSGRPHLNLTIQYAKAFYEVLSSLRPSDREVAMQRLYRLLSGVEKTARSTGFGKPLSALSSGYSELKWGPLRIIFKYDIVTAFPESDPRHRQITFYLYWYKKDSSNKGKILDAALEAASQHILRPGDPEVDELNAWLYGESGEGLIDLSDFELVRAHIGAFCFGPAHYASDLSHFFKIHQAQMKLLSPAGKDILHSAIHQMQEVLQEEEGDLNRAAIRWLGKGVPSEILQAARSLLENWIGMKERLLFLMGQGDPGLKNIAKIYFLMAGPGFRKEIQGWIEAWAKSQPMNYEGLKRIIDGDVELKKHPKDGDPFRSPVLEKMIEERRELLRTPTVPSNPVAEVEEKKEAEEAAAPAPVVLSPVTKEVASAPKQLEPESFKFPDTPQLEKAVKEVEALLKEQGISQNKISEALATTALEIEFAPRISNTEKTKRLLKLFSFEAKKTTGFRRRLREIGFSLVKGELAPAAVREYLEEFLREAQRTFNNRDLERAKRLVERVESDASGAGAASLNAEAAVLAADIQSVEKWMAKFFMDSGELIPLKEAALPELVTIWDALSPKSQGIIRNILFSAENKEKLKKLGDQSVFVAGYFLPFIEGDRIEGVPMRITLTFFGISKLLSKSQIHNGIQELVKVLYAGYNVYSKDLSLLGPTDLKSVIRQMNEENRSDLFRSEIRVVDASLPDRQGSSAKSVDVSLEVRAETGNKPVVNAAEVKDFLKVIEGTFFRVMRQEKLIGLKRDPLNLLDVRCMLASDILAKLVSARFQIPVGGETPFRVEVVQGIYEKTGFDHFWNAFYAGAKEPALFLDGSYGQFVPSLEGSLLVEEYLLALKKRGLKETQRAPANVYVNEKAKNRGEKAYKTLLKALSEEGLLGPQGVGPWLAQPSDDHGASPRRAEVRTIKIKLEIEGFQEIQELLEKFQEEVDHGHEVPESEALRSVTKLNRPGFYEIEWSEAAAPSLQDLVTRLDQGRKIGQRTPIYVNSIKYAGDRSGQQIGPNHFIKIKDPSEPRPQIKRAKKALKKTSSVTQARKKQAEAAEKNREWWRYFDGVLEKPKQFDLI